MAKRSEQEVWNLPDHVMLQAEMATKKFEVKHGMFAAIPLICKGDSCPYRAVCTISKAVIPTGHRCPIEIGAIMTRFDHWCKHFRIEASNDVIKDEDLVDATLIRDLVDIEIQVLRAENRIALSADFIASTLTTVDNKGRAYYKDEVSPEAQFKLQLLDKRYKIMNLLNSTRKDKSKEIKLELTPSQQAVSMFSKISEKLKNAEIEV
jgi:hypothetical protein